MTANIGGSHPTFNSGHHGDGSSSVAFRTSIQHRQAQEEGRSFRSRACFLRCVIPCLKTAKEDEEEGLKGLSFRASRLHHRKEKKDRQPILLLFPISRPVVDGYDCLCLLGEGEFDKVLLARRSDDRVFAIKGMPRARIESKEWSFLARQEELVLQNNQGNPFLASLEVATRVDPFCYALLHWRRAIGIDCQ